MSKFSRRGLLAAGAAGTALGLMPAGGWLGKAALAATKTRHNVASPEGLANLEIYAGAVRTMMNTPESDPRSWTFQWYTHWTKGTRQDDRSKYEEMQRIFGGGSSPNKSLANEMWNTCQAHAASNTQEENFLPWHRMYVLYLEEIVRAVSGKPDFTLPYWDYTDPAHAAIPEQFRLSNDATWGSLYRADRNRGVNNGVPIDDGMRGNPLSLVSMGQLLYLPSSRVNQGFNQTLDFGLHGNVHGLTGTGTNMGFVPTAAGDPIFWLHHCNIDRIWASWNAEGGVNPPDSWNDWGNRSFVFANGAGNRVVSKIADVTKGTVVLGYDYNVYLKAPVQQGAKSLVSMSSLRDSAVAGAATTMLATVAPGPTNISLGRTGATVSLNNALTDSSLTDKLSALAMPAAGPSSIYLVVDDLSTNMQPGVIYGVYLDLPDGVTGEEADKYVAGYINFFHAHAADGSHAGHHKKVGYSFDVTTLVADLRESNALKQSPTVSILPSGESVADASPIVGSVELIAQ